LHSQALFTNQLIPLIKRGIQIADASKVVVVTDQNTSQHCLPLIKNVPFDLHYELKSGETHKNKTAYLQLIEFLIDHNLDRNTLLIALGGGVVTDLVGFVAASFKRGVTYINIPTTLLAMVDAAVGGKTGIDHHFVKNVIGSFYPPQYIISNHTFLHTLPQTELKSGWGEVIKHLLIANQSIPTNIPEINNDLISEWSAIKYRIILADPKEKKERLALNAGHTVGHALEGHYLKKKDPIPHGYAVAAGMLIESLITIELINDNWAYKQLEHAILPMYDKIDYTAEDIPTLIALMKQDKKNINNQIRCSLIKENGILLATPVTSDIIEIALLKYIQL